MLGRVSEPCALSELCSTTPCSVVPEGCPALSLTRCPPLPSAVPARGNEATSLRRPGLPTSRVSAGKDRPRSTCNSPKPLLPPQNPGPGQPPSHAGRWPHPFSLASSQHRLARGHLPSSLPHTAHCPHLCKELCNALQCHCAQSVSLIHPPSSYLLSLVDRLQFYYFKCYL